MKDIEKYSNKIIDNSLESIVVSDSRGTITRVNKTLLDLLGYTKEELIGKGTGIFLQVDEGVYESTANEKVIFDEDTFKELKETIEKLFEDGKIQNWETYCVRKDGMLVPVEENIALLYDEKDIMIGSVGFFRDITERKKAEAEILRSRDHLNDRIKEKTAELISANKLLTKSNEQLVASETALRESEKRYRILVEKMNEGLVIRDSKGIFSYVNDRFCKMLGFEKKELIGHPLEAFLDTKNKNILKAEIEKRKKGGSEKYEISWLKKNGEGLSSIVSPQPVFDSDGILIESFAIITNISELKIAEKKLRESKDFLENIFMTTVEGLMVSNSKGNIIRINSAMEEILGYKEEELLGKATTDLLPQDQKYHKMSEEMIKQLYEKGYVKDFETVWRRKDGSMCPVEFNLTFLKDSEGNRTGAVGAIHDISERKKIEKQLLQSEKLKSLGELAGGVAHDFNNVLAAILGRAQLLTRRLDMPENKLGRENLFDELKKGLATIEKAALDGSETVRRVQEFSKKRDNDKYFDIIDLKNIVDSALEFTKIRWKNEAERKGVLYDIKVEVAQGSKVRGNGSELREVFINLINNAIDAMPQGGNLCITSCEGNNRFVLKLIDSGIGIPPSIIERIFDPFFTTKGPRSTGLGMSVSFGIITRHKGTILVESIEGEGTVFTLTLPAAERNEPLEEKPGPIIPAQNISILVIEDEKEVRLLLADLLSSEGHSVKTASDGSEGIDLFKKNKFDMVFTDLGMPGMSGWQVSKEIKNAGPETPVVLITGWEVLHQEEDIKNSGVDMVIQKPFKLSQIAGVIKECRALKNKKT